MTEWLLIGVPVFVVALAALIVELIVRMRRENPLTPMILFGDAIVRLQIQIGERLIPAFKVLTATMVRATKSLNALTEQLKKYKEEEVDAN